MPADLKESLNNRIHRENNFRKWLRFFPLTLFLVLVGLGIALLYLWVVQPVSIYVDGELYKEIKTVSRTVEEVLDEVDLELHSQDKISPGTDEFISRNDNIEILKAFPVLVNADNGIERVWTTTSTVEELLKEEDLELREYDEVEPGLREKLEPYDEIKITRIDKVYETEEKTIPYETVYKDNPNLDRGRNRVVSPGEEGVKEKKIEVVYENGDEVESSVVEENIVAPPEEKIVERGTRTTVPGKPVEFERSLNVQATAYCANDPSAGTTGRTATGRRAVPGAGSRENPHIIAVDPRVIPLGTEVYIEGYGYAVAQDTGGAIKGERIDLLVGSQQAAYSFGRRNLKIYILP